jgi:hypothetical protein
MAFDLGTAIRVDGELDAVVVRLTRLPKMGNSLLAR